MSGRSFVDYDVPGNTLVRRDYVNRILLDIIDERNRQDAKFGWPAPPNPSPCHVAGTNPHGKLAVLMEEVGEVARALIECDPLPHLREELVQCAAVCAAWIQSIDERGV